jgi:hypothetical protein
LLREDGVVGRKQHERQLFVLVAVVDDDEARAAVGLEATSASTRQRMPAR